MDPLTFLFLVFAGIAAGLAGAVAGIASVFSYPALLMTGLGPVQANITNTISLLALSFGSIPASAREWKTQKPVLKTLILPVLIGGIIGAMLLLNTPPTTFGRIAPFLIMIGSLVILLPKKFSFNPQKKHTLLLVVIMTFVGIYCGYFGAGAGTITTALMILTIGAELAVATALKNVLLFAANAMAVLLFLFSGQVAWLYALPLAIGFYIGGRIGPVIVRKANPKVLRWFVACFGVGVAVWMLIR
jgi:uncharacterized membrane protein YfcA